MKKYEIMEDGVEFTTIEAESAEKALELVDAPISGDYPSESTTWVQWYAKNVDDADDVDSRTFQVDPDEPDCEAGHQHDWSEHEPARGSGGGVVFSDQCKHCRAIKHTDTWATNPSDGSGGHTSIRYSDETEETDEPNTSEND